MVKNDDIIALYREDLIERKKDISSNRINLEEDFKRETISLQDIRKANTIIFVDTDKSMQLLKDRYNKLL